MIIVKVIFYVNMENHFLTFTKEITFTSIMLGTPLKQIMIHYHSAINLNPVNPFGNQSKNPAVNIDSVAGGRTC